MSDEQIPANSKDEYIRRLEPHIGHDAAISMTHYNGPYGMSAGRPGWKRKYCGGSSFESGSVWPASLHVCPNSDGWHFEINNAAGGEYGHELNTGGYEHRAKSESDAQLVAEEILCGIVRKQHAYLVSLGLLPTP